MLHSTNHRDFHYPDEASVTGELALDGRWDSAAVRALIDSKCGPGHSPAFLVLGKTEATLLKEHLAQAFGEEAVHTLKGTHYMGLEVVEVPCGSFLAAAGRKIRRPPEDHLRSRTGSDHSIWRLRLD